MMPISRLLIDDVIAVSAPAILIDAYTLQRSSLWFLTAHGRLVVQSITPPVIDVQVQLREQNKVETKSSHNATIQPLPNNGCVLALLPAGMLTAARLSLKCHICT